MKRREFLQTSLLGVASVEIDPSSAAASAAQGATRLCEVTVEGRSWDPWCRLEGWSKEQAEVCLRDNTALPETSVVRETQRYIAWPAQALAYKVGELRFLAGPPAGRVGALRAVRHSGVP
jgi:hypothetical protein